MMCKNEKGFTLAEVIVSIVIVSIILLSFFQLFIQHTKIAGSNTEKLITVNISQAYLERLKLERANPSDPVYSEPYEMILNDQSYTITVKTSQNENEKEMKLLNVVVTTTSSDEKTKGVVEGYVKYD